MDHGEPIHVTAGFSWTAAGAWASFFALLGLIIRQWVPLRKLRVDEFERVNSAQAAEIARLSGRIDRLEQAIENQRGYYEARLAFEQAAHQGELSLQRHATRNAKQILGALLDLIEAAPSKASAHAAKMREKMQELEKTEIEEAATIRAAMIVATGHRAAESAPTEEAEA